MTNILVLAGKKQSGKSTAAKFVLSYHITQLARKGVPYLPTKFTVDDTNGEVLISTPNNPSLIDQIERWHTLDLKTDDYNFQVWLNDCVYPHIKTYSFADMLKAVLSIVFGIPEELMNGTDKDKMTLTHIKWKNFSSFLSSKTIHDLKVLDQYDKAMTVRDVMQYFGTNVCRKIYDPCWIESCYKRIEMEQPDIAIIDDCRFRNEVMASKKKKARIVKLCRSVDSDKHKSETDLDKMHHNNFDLVIPEGATIKEKNQLILDKMYEWGWFEKYEKLGVN